MSVAILELSLKLNYENYQLKLNLKEGEDYMLVDSNIYHFWLSKYQMINEIKRFGIEDESGETCVEIYLKRFNIYPIPNLKLFKLAPKEDGDSYDKFT